MQEQKIEELHQIATQIRRDIVRMVHGASSGHPGGSLGCADLLTVLFFHTMKYDAQQFDMRGDGEDMFFLSNGHISPLFYAVLARAGFFPKEELQTFRKLNSRLQGHPATDEGLPGIRIASGSLGQGLSVAVGNAIGKKLHNDTRYTYVLLGDGELQEGQVWEASMLAAHRELHHLIGFVDHNKKQIDGNTDDVLSLGSLHDKFTAFGWQVLEVDGHDVVAISDIIERAKQEGKHHRKPVMIITHTVMGKGVDFMEGDYKWHGIAPNNEQTEKALQQLSLELAHDY